MLLQCRGGHKVELSPLNGRHGMLNVHCCVDDSTICDDPNVSLQSFQECWRETRGLKQVCNSGVPVYLGQLF